LQESGANTPKVAEDRSGETMSRSKYLLALMLLCAGRQPAPAADYVWLEAEASTRANVKFKVGAWGHPEYLSGGKWLHAGIEPKDMEKTIPEGGALLAYDFKATKAGDYAVWIRLGYEFVRSPLEWRLDDGKWSRVAPDQLTTDLMLLQDWNEVAWLNAGKVALKEGKHTLEVRFPRPYKQDKGKKVPDRILFGLDCFCLSRTPFIPNGPHRPDARWQTDSDRAAAKKVFTLKPAKGAERAVLHLGGTWQVARWDEVTVKDRTGPTRALPPGHAGLPWKAIAVPGNRDEVRPDLTFCHRFIYRTRVKVPAEMKGRSFFLRFPSTVLIASCLVNGKYCGYSKAPCAPWDCDISSAVKPGEVNEVCLVIKDLYYALAQTGEGKSVRYAFNLPHQWFFAGGLNASRYADFPVLYHVRASGILETPSLVSTGLVYTSDVFARPSVKKKELGLEVSVKNPTGKALKVSIANEVVPLGGDRAEKTFKALEASVPAGEEKTLQLAEGWKKPKLWWPDDPRQYEVVTRLSVAGKVVDVQRTKFGFREWGWKGKTFTLNGIPWHLRADLTGNEATDKPLEAVKAWRRTGQNMFRYWGHKPWTGTSRKETLDFFDAHGVPVRCSGIFDGQVASYVLIEQKNGKHVARKALFDNWIEQLRAWVKAERNHPSIFIWAIENEITYINTRNLGWLDFVEPEIRRAAQAVMKMDPTRPAMIDGGDALRDRSLPVYGNHYNEFALREYPDEAYTLKLAQRRFKMPGRDPWPIGEDKPLFLGESFFASGYQPSAFSQVAGEGAFLGWQEAQKGAGLFAKMLSEGYRWWGVAAFHFWLGPDRAEAHYNSWQPVCVLCREWDWTFGSRQRVKRTLRIFNDTRFGAPITMRYVVKVAGKEVARGSATRAIALGGTHDRDAEFEVPAVKGRTAGEMVLTCERGGKEVFREVKKLWVIPVDAVPRPKLTAKELVVLDPKGVVKARLKKRGIPFTEVKSFDALPRAKVVVVGPNALTARQATDPRWQALAAGGARVLVLDQDNPLHYQAVPADLEVSDHAGRIAFSENLEHPIFRGLDQPDFFCWSGDHIVYRNAYKKARGAHSLVQCDEELSCSALTECPVRDGLLVLSQLALGARLGRDAVAQRLFDNLLDYCAGYRPPARKTALVFARDDLRAKMLAATGLQHTHVRDVLAAVKDKRNDIVVVDATPAKLKKLADNRASLEAFNARGGWLMLWGVTPEGLASFNTVVGQNHVIRPFRLERVTLPAMRDPILSGLTMRDVVLLSTRKIFPWSGDLYPSNDVFTHVVDLDDIAPFCSCPKQAYGWSQMTNGLVSADAWVFIFSHNLKDDPRPRWTARLPKEEEVVKFTIVPNTFYHHITKLRLIFDGKEKDAVTLDLKPAMVKQDFAINLKRKVKRITLHPLEWKTVGKAPVISIENLWIWVKRSPEYRKQVVPLLNIGALVKYRRGKGGILLNQLRIQAREENPVNVEKKQTIAATLLRNLGAVFAGGKTLIAGANLRYQPIPLGEKCNQFLTADKGWLKGKQDLKHFPVGEVRLTGVTYRVRDFRTSPLPACIMLAGPDARGTLPREVKGIPVGRKADVLFFLHTFHQVRDWKPGSGAEAKPPVVFKYVVHYADAKTAEVPVQLTRGVGRWVLEKPQGLPGAAVAWAAPFTKESAQQAVVYQMPWKNPRPGVAIKSIDVAYDAKGGSAYGVPAVLGITAATAE
jgi:beta-galactosidase